MNSGVQFSLPQKKIFCEYDKLPGDTFNSNFYLENYADLYQKQIPTILGYPNDKAVFFQTKSEFNFKKPIFSIGPSHTGSEDIPNKAMVTFFKVILNFLIFIVFEYSWSRKHNGWLYKSRI